MNNQNHKILPQNDIESLNEVVELDDIELEIISGGYFGKYYYYNSEQRVTSKKKVNEIALNSNGVENQIDLNPGRNDAGVFSSSVSNSGASASATG